MFILFLITIILYVNEVEINEVLRDEIKELKKELDSYKIIK